MAHETTHHVFRHTNLPNESADYLSKREELRLAEIELMHQRERVANLRRRLPEGAIVQDYVFEEVPADLDAGDTPIRTVRLSELFTAIGLFGIDHVKSVAAQKLDSVGKMFPTGGEA